MIIPLITGATVGSAFLVASRLFVGNREIWFDSIMGKSVGTGILLGVLSGSIIALCSEDIAIEGFYIDKQVQQRLFSDSTIVLVNISGVEKQVQLSDVVLGLNKGDKVVIKGQLYLIPQLNEFNTIEKM